MRTRSGLTLVEVLAVVVILALIATSVAIGVGSYMGQARSKISITQIKKIEMQLQAYNLEKGAYPNSGEGLQVLVQAPRSAAYHLDPAEVNDPWNRPYIYQVPGPDGAPYEIKTLGANGIEGGEGEDADVSSESIRKVK